MAEVATNPKKRTTLAGPAPVFSGRRSASPSGYSMPLDLILDLPLGSPLHLNLSLGPYFPGTTLDPLPMPVPLDLSLFPPLPLLLTLASHLSSYPLLLVRAHNCVYVPVSEDEDCGMSESCGVKRLRHEKVIQQLIWAEMRAKWQNMAGAGGTLTSFSKTSGLTLNDRGGSLWGP